MLRHRWIRRRAGKPSRSEFVRRILPKGGVAAELGVYKGDFSQELLELTRPKRLHLIDPWYLQGKEWQWGEDRSTVAALTRLIKKLEDELARGTVTLNIGNDLEVLPQFPDRYFDWVYIDTLHFYEHTRDELTLLKTKVKVDGVIAGDDWLPDPSHRHHGVCRAVTEFVQAAPYELIYANEQDLQWAISATS
jgi:hypothetical protein